MDGPLILFWSLIATAAGLLTFGLSYRFSHMKAQARRRAAAEGRGK